MVLRLKVYGDILVLTKYIILYYDMDIRLWGHNIESGNLKEGASIFLSMWILDPQLVILFG